MGYIAKVKRIDKKNKRIALGDKTFTYRYVVPWVEGPRGKLETGIEVSYSNAGNTITWIGRATPEYKRIARELREKYAKKGKAIPAQMRIRLIIKKDGVKKHAKR